jgi:pyridoxal phosphate enzyme (YggS family)
VTDPEPGSAGARRAELKARWEALARRVAAAAAAAGRRPSELTVIAVTKTWPASDVAALRALGVVDIGENRAQELASKIAELGHEPGPALRWHFIGQLQRNKAALVGRHCAALHTLDRASLIPPLCHAAAAAGRRLDVFLQLSLDGDRRRGGLTQDQLALVADDVAGVAELRLAGLMALPPLGAPPRPAFARLRAASERLRLAHPGATALSAGMSADLEEAVIEGATHLRIGTVLMGSRA